MTQVSPDGKALSVPKTVAEARSEQECMYDVLLLLESLFHREEDTIKLILGRLYDVGAVNLLNQKVHPAPLNRLGKSATRLTKPVFTVIAINWFHKNCPKLLVDWLHSKVAFSEAEAAAVAATNPAADLDTAVEAAKENKPVGEVVAERAELAAASEPIPSQVPPTAVAPEVTALQAVPVVNPGLLAAREAEVLRLRSQVRSLKLALVGVTLALGGTATWLALSPQAETASSVRQAVNCTPPELLGNQACQ